MEPGSEPVLRLGMRMGVGLGIGPETVLDPGREQGAEVQLELLPVRGPWPALGQSLALGLKVKEEPELGLGLGPRLGPGLGPGLEVEPGQG